MRPLVSILIPAYNAQEWIADTISSAIAQTWERKESIVIDDGSNDRTLGIIKVLPQGAGQSLLSQQGRLHRMAGRG